MSDQYKTDQGKPVIRGFSQIQELGLLWLINTSVFHPRGYALTFNYGEDEDGNMVLVGWSMQGDGTETWSMGDDFKAEFTQSKEFLSVDHGHFQPIKQDEADS